MNPKDEHTMIKSWQFCLWLEIKHRHEFCKFRDEFEKCVAESRGED